MEDNILDIANYVVCNMELDYEESDKSSSANIASFPTPEVKYMMNLQYVARLCNMIAKKYNSTFAMGEEN